MPENENGNMSDTDLMCPLLSNNIIYVGYLVEMWFYLQTFVVVVLGRTSVTCEVAHYIPKMKRWPKSILYFCAKRSILSLTVDIINVFSNDNLIDLGFAQTIFPFLMILKIICLQGRNYYYLSAIINYFFLRDLFSYSHFFIFYVIIVIFHFTILFLGIGKSSRNFICK